MLLFTSAHEPGKNPYGSHILERYDRLHDLGDPFPDASGLEGFQWVRGNRDVGFSRGIPFACRYPPAAESELRQEEVPATNR